MIKWKTHSEACITRTHIFKHQLNYQSTFTLEFQSKGGRCHHSPRPLSSSLLTLKPSTKAQQRAASTHLHTWGHTGTDTLHITLPAAYSCPSGQLGVLGNFFFTLLLFKCIIRRVTREEVGEKVVPESGMFYWCKSSFISSESFILTAKVPGVYYLRINKLYKVYGAEKYNHALSNLVSNFEDLIQGLSKL